MVFSGGKGRKVSASVAVFAASANVDLRLRL